MVKGSNNGTDIKQHRIPNLKMGLEEIQARNLVLVIRQNSRLALLRVGLGGKKAITIRNLVSPLSRSTAPPLLHNFLGGTCMLRIAFSG